MQSVFSHNGADLIVKFSGDDHGIYVNGEQVYRFSTPGVICVVLDTTSNTCVDVVTFAPQTNFELSR